MASKLNGPGEAHTYREFRGRITNMMPRLIEEGFSPMTFAQVMERRLDVLGGHKAVTKAWWNSGFDTADAIAYHPDGRAKILLNPLIVRKLNPESNWRKGALVLPDGLYEKLSGEEFSWRRVEGMGLHMGERRWALNHPVWRALARDPKLHKEYVRAVFREAWHYHYGYMSDWNYTHHMWVDVAPWEEAPLLRVWRLGALTRDRHSEAEARGITVGRLVGVAPGAQRSHSP